MQRNLCSYRAENDMPAPAEQSGNIPKKYSHSKYFGCPKSGIYRVIRWMSKDILSSLWGAGKAPAEGIYRVYGTNDRKLRRQNGTKTAIDSVYKGN